LLAALNGIEHELGEVRRKIEEHEGNCDGGDGHHEEGGDEATPDVEEEVVEENTTPAVPRIRCHLDEYKNKEGECLPCDGAPDPGAPAGCASCYFDTWGGGLSCRACTFPNTFEFDENDNLFCKDGPQDAQPKKEDDCEAN